MPSCLRCLTPHALANRREMLDHDLVLYMHEVPGRSCRRRSAETSGSALLTPVDISIGGRSLPPIGSPGSPQPSVLVTMAASRPVTAATSTRFNTLTLPGPAPPHCRLSRFVRLNETLSFVGRHSSRPAWRRACRLRWLCFPFVTAESLPTFVRIVDGRRAYRYEIKLYKSHSRVEGDRKKSGWSKTVTGNC